ncbi:MAG: helix-turn-helix transcriptional regulator [Thermomicrobiales bacterium]|nr:helix-turn-helix transcriptional regulator [Thermomicrobiales bacterium]
MSRANLDHPLAYQEFAPPPHLRGYVACFWRSQARDQSRQTTVLPDGCIDLIWPAGDEAFVAGPMTVPVHALSPPGTTMLGVRFVPGVAAALLRAPAAELRDLRVPLAELWPASRRSSPQDRALAITEAPSLADAEAVVVALIRQAAPPDRFVADACRWFAHNPGAPTSSFVTGSGVSERQARRRFHEHVGYGPKTLQRILRLQRALWLLSRPVTSPSLAHLAQAAGYADQAHLTREVRALTGQLPTALAANEPQSAVADLFKTPLA